MMPTFLVELTTGTVLEEAFILFPRTISPKDALSLNHPPIVGVPIRCGMGQVVLVSKLYANCNMCREYLLPSYRLCTYVISIARPPGLLVSERTHSKCFSGARQALPKITWIATFPSED